MQVDFAQFSFLFCLCLVQDGIEEDTWQHGVIKNENGDWQIASVILFGEWDTDL